MFKILFFLLLALNLLAVTLSIQKGWNLVSTLGEKEVSIQSLLSQLPSHSIVWKYDNSAKVWQAKSNSQEIDKLIKEHNITYIDTIGSSDGFWIKSWAAKELTFTPNDTQRSLDIKSGWNLVATRGKEISTDALLAQLEVNSTLFLYKDGEWFAKSNSPLLNLLIEKKANRIKASQGFWIYNNSKEAILYIDESFAKSECVYSNIDGLESCAKPKHFSKYKLDQLSDEEFYSYSNEKRLKIADNLLTTLFFGMPLNALEQQIKRGHFLEQIRMDLRRRMIDERSIEETLLDTIKFYRYTSKYIEQQAIDILTRFYLMDKLDHTYLSHWIAYILTQTVMFSPAYELDTSHPPDISRVYNMLFKMQKSGYGMRYISYRYMLNEVNWRRFRSPEDNGREMLEIFTLDYNDSHVPLAAKALQNYKLNTNSDTLEISLNENRDPIYLFGTTIYNGEDFYRDLVKSDDFVEGVTKRLVDFFFPDKNETIKLSFVHKIVSSHPENWEDILLQIIFSKAYLLYNSRPRSAEELFFSLSKKISYNHFYRTFVDFKYALEQMHQASMKYKLGRLERVPLDTLSFAYYHSFIRDRVLLRYSKSEMENNYTTSLREGWQLSFIDMSNFPYNSADDVYSLRSFIDYLFQSTIARRCEDEEFELFKNHMIEPRDGKFLFRNEFNIFKTYEDKEEEKRKQLERRINVAFIVLDYISRLDELYVHREVQK